MVEFVNVRALHLALIGTVTESNTLHQSIGAGLQVNKQVRLLDLLCQRFMHLVVHIELIAFEIDLRKERILRKGVIGEKIIAGRNEFMHSPPLLMIATQ